MSSSKEVIVSSIKKVFLNLKGVEDYYIFLNNKSNKIELSSYVIAHKSAVLSYCTIKKDTLSITDIIIRDPERLLKFLAITNENLKIKQADNILLLEDGVYESEFVLCDPSAVPIKMPYIEEPISYDIQMVFTEELINKFFAAKKANNCEILSVEAKDRKMKFELGEDTSYGNKIKFSVETDGVFDVPKMLFSSDIVEEIFSRNKGLEGKMFVSQEGLMKLSYLDKDSGAESKYFLIALDKI